MKVSHKRLKEFNTRQPLQLGSIKEIAQSKLYSELGFESLKFRCWFRKLCTFFGLKTTSLPEYLFDRIPQNNHLSVLVLQ